MIIEFEDFEKYVSQQEWGLIRDQLRDGEINIFSETTGNHKDFEHIWFLIGCFRERHDIPHTCRDPDGNPISEREHFKIRDEYIENYYVGAIDE